MKQIYLALALIGAAIPLLLFAGHFAAEGFSPAAFVAAAFANPAAAGFAADVLLSSFVFWLWMRGRDGPRPWLFILLNLGIGLSCALPAYLYASVSASGRHAHTRTLFCKNIPRGTRAVPARIVQHRSPHQTKTAANLWPGRAGARTKHRAPP